MVKFIVRFFRNSAMKKITGERTVKYRDIRNIRTCGFVFSSGDTFIVNTVSIVEKNLKDHNIEYEGIAFNLARKPEKIDKFEKDKNIRRIDKADVNWYGLPKKDVLDEFAEKPFDLLIDLTEGNASFALRHTIARSKASFKAGFNPENEDLYDFTVYPSKEDTGHTDDIIRAVFRYLSDMKNTGENK